MFRAIWFNVLSNQVKVSFHIFLKLGRGVVFIYHSKAKRQPFCIKWGGVWSTSTYSCRARYSERALITRQSPCADLVTSVRISPPARPDVSTIILVFSIYVHVFGFWFLGKYTLWLWLTCCCTVCRISADIIDILYVYILYTTTRIYSHVCCSDHSQNDNNFTIYSS